MALTLSCQLKLLKQIPISEYVPAYCATVYTSPTHFVNRKHDSPRSIVLKHLCCELHITFQVDIMSLVSCFIYSYYNNICEHVAVNYSTILQIFCEVADTFILSSYGTIVGI